MISNSMNGDIIFMGAAHIVLNPLVEGGAANFQYLWVDGVVTVKLARKEMDLSVAGFGPISNPLLDEMVEVTFTPASQVSAAILNYLYGNILSAMPGQSWFGSTSTPIGIHTMSGKIMIIANCCPTVFPSVNFGMAPKRFDGSVTLTGLLQRGAVRTAANALFTPWATQVFTAVPAEGDFPCQECSVSWNAYKDGDGNIIPIQSMAPWKFTPKVKLTPRTVANLGTIDYTIDEIVLEAECDPANMQIADLWAATVIGASRALGSTIAGATLTLTENNPGITGTIINSRLIQPSTTFDVTKPVAGKCTWRSHRTSVAGIWSAAGTIGITPA